MQEKEITLSFRTRGMKNPKGLPRVFFAAHPEERDTFLDKAWEMLDRYQDIVLFYEDAYLSWAELSGLLADMQLIVIPVTTRLLTDENRTINEILPFIEERHIPVLPLMMENGLDGLFCKVFGDLQYITPWNNDPTAIPFEQKLEKYLESMLVGSDMAQRVRDAFDAYIFLSYRKKDRSYAQKLMRLIHKNDRFRDIAIWYDEYLIPGEDFNTSIQQALEKGLLFTLVVTPSLLEKNNYVMQYEYPAAVESGKPILPVEMVETEREKLDFFYRSIPDAVKVYENDDLTPVLSRYLAGIAAQKTDDPIHNFLIGLAYLDGIDVEVDYKKAVSLIKDAAESGVEEAIKKLVAMYHEGKAVERDYKESAVWQERLVEHYRATWHESEDTSSLCRLTDELWELGEAYYDLRDYESAKNTYLEMQRYLRKQENDDRYHNMMIFYCRVGNIERNLGNLQKAAEFYQRGLEVSNYQAEYIHAKMSHLDQAQCYGELGDIELSLGRLEEAKRNYLNSIIILIMLDSDEPTTQERRVKALTYIRLGNVEMGLRNVEKAKENYQNALEIRQQLAEETHATEALNDLAESYSFMGDIEQGKDNLKEAKDFYVKALHIFEQLAEETHSIQFRRGLIVIYSKLGNIERSLGNIKEAKTHFLKGLEISEQLVKETHTIESRRDLNVMCSKLGDIEMDYGNVGGAMQYYQRMIDIREQLLEETQTNELRRDLSVGYNRMGDIEKNLGNLEKAKRHYQKALVIVEQLTEETHTIESRRDLIVSYDKLGSTEQELGNIGEAKRLFRKELEISEQLENETHTIESSRDLASVYSRLGEIEYRLKNLDEAKQFFKNALMYNELVSMATHAVKCRIELASCYGRIGDVEQDLGNLEEAKQFYLKSLNISGQIAKENPTPESVDSLAEGYFRIGTLGGRIDKRYITEGYKIWSFLAEACPSVYMYRKKRDLMKQLMMIVV